MPRLLNQNRKSQRSQGRAHSLASCFKHYAQAILPPHSTNMHPHTHTHTHTQGQVSICLDPSGLTHVSTRQGPEPCLAFGQRWIFTVIYQEPLYIPFWWCKHHRFKIIRDPCFCSKGSNIGSSHPVTIRKCELLPFQRQTH